MCGAAVGAAALVTACDRMPTASAPTTTGTTPPSVAATPVAAVAVAPGDCVGGLSIGTSERSRIESVPVVSCDEPHAIEVFAVFPFPDDATSAGEPDPGIYPGQQRVVDAADAGCEERFDAAVADPDAFGLIALWPTAMSWSEGDRTIACGVYAADGERMQGRTAT